METNKVKVATQNGYISLFGRKDPTHEEVYRPVRTLNVKHGDEMIEKVQYSGRFFSKKKVCVGQSYLDTADIENRHFQFTRLQSVAHPFIVPIVDHYPEPNGEDRWGDDLYFGTVVREWVEGQTLEAAIQGGLSEAKIFRYFTMIILALEQTHEQGIFHRNISSAHIYIQEDGDVAKLANHINPLSLKRYHQHPGEWYYLPPELQHVNPHHSDQDDDEPEPEYTDKQEVFALGMLLLEMLSGQKPHFDRKDRQSQIVLTKSQLESGEYHRLVDSASFYAHSILEAMLQVDPEKRATLHDVVHMPGLINELKRLEISQDFHRGLQAAFQWRLDLGWSRKEDLRTFQPNYPGKNPVGWMGPPDLVQKYFARLKPSGKTFRLSQFRVMVRSQEERNRVLEGIKKDKNLDFSFESGQMSIAADETDWRSCPPPFEKIKDLPEMADDDLQSNYEEIVGLADQMFTHRLNSEGDTVGLSDLSLQIDSPKSEEAKPAVLESVSPNMPSIPNFAQDLAKKPKTKLMVNFGKGMNIIIRSQGFLIKAQKSLAEGNYPESIDAAQTVIRFKDRNTSEGQYVLGQAFKLFQRPLDSMRSFSVTLKEDSNHVAAQVNLANLLLEYGMETLAAYYFKRVLSTHPSSVSAQMGQILATRASSDAIEEVVAVIKWKLQQDPKNVALLTQQAIYRFFDYDDLTCLKLLKKALSYDHNYLPALVATGEIMRMTGHSAEAKKYFGQALRIDEGLTTATKGLIMSCIETNSTGDDILEHFETVRTFNVNPIQPESDLLHFCADFRDRLRVIFLHQREYQEASLLFLDALEKDHNDAIVKDELVRIAVVLSNEEEPKYDRAIELLSSVLNADKEHLVAKDEFVRISNIFEEKGDLDRSIALLMQVLRADIEHQPTKAALVKLAAQLTQENELKKATEILLDVHSVDQDFLQAKDELIKLAFLLREQEREAEATEMLGKVLKIDNKRAIELLLPKLETHMNFCQTKQQLASLYRISGFPDKAVIVLMDVLRIDRSYTAAKDELVTIARQFRKQKQREKTVELLNALLQKVDENFAPAKMELATLFSEIGHLQRAVTLLIEIIMLDKDFTTATDLLVKLAGWYEEGGQHDAAREILLKTLAVDSTFVAAKDALVTLSKKYTELGSREKAVLLLIEVVRSDPAYAPAKEELQTYTLENVIAKHKETQSYIQESIILNWIIALCDEIVKDDEEQLRDFLICTRNLYYLDAKIALGRLLGVPSHLELTEENASNVIWSMGRVLLTMSTDQEEVGEEEIGRGELPAMSAFYGTRLQNLITAMLSPDPTKRPQADQILHMEVITQFQWEEQNKRQPQMKWFLSKALGKGVEWFQKDYVKIRELGRGGSGLLYLCMRHKDNQLFTAKEQICTHNSNYQMAKAEFEIGIKVAHKNLIGYDCIYDSPDKLCTILVQEYCPQGRLSHEVRFLRSRGESVTQPFCLSMLRQILEGLSATHELNVYHADLMLDNIFVMPLGQIKLANFFAELPTAYYMAPESFNKLESGPREEMWAIGCAMHEMVSGRPAFRSNSKDQNSMADIKIRVQEQYPRRLNPQISRVLRTMIFRMLSKEKEERPSVEELLESKLLEVSEAGVQLIQPKGPTPSVEAISKDEEVRKSYVPQGNEQTLHCQSTKDYIDEGLRATDMINMSCWGIQAPCPFVPSREALLEESPLAVYKQSLTALLHDEGEMSRTTFQFGELISPPKGRYRGAPSVSIPVPATLDITSIHFKTCKHQTNVWLYSLMMFENCEKVIELCDQRLNQHHETLEIELKSGERIVSARVDVDNSGYWPVNVSLLLYDYV